MPLNDGSQCLYFIGIADVLQLHQFGIAARGKYSRRIQDIGDASGHALADIVICLTMQNQMHTGQAKCAKTLPGRSMKYTGNAYTWQAYIAVAACDLPCQTSPNCAIIVVDVMLSQHTAFTRESLF